MSAEPSHEFKDKSKSKSLPSYSSFRAPMSTTGLIAALDSSELDLEDPSQSTRYHNAEGVRMIPTGEQNVYK